MPDDIKAAREHGPSLQDRIERTPDLLLDRREVEQVFGLSKRWLELAAVSGTGPPMIRVSARMVRYRVSDLREWIAARRVTSTSDKA